MRSELLRGALSVGHCVAFEKAFQTVLVGSHCRRFEIRAWAVLVAVPYWNGGVSALCSA